MKRGLSQAGLLPICLAVFAGAAASQTPGGYALRFDGVNDLVTFGTVTRLSAHTIEVWVKPERAVTSTIAGHVAGPQQACSLGTSLGTTNEGGCYTVDISGCGNGDRICSPIPLNVWTHLAGTYDGNVMRLFVNGSLAAEKGNIPFHPSNYMTAGASVFFNGPQEYFPGEMDELRIWNRARTAEEIAQAMRRTLSGSEAGLAGYWKFDEGAGQEVRDSSPSNVTGFLGRTAAAEASDPAWVVSSAPLGAVIEKVVSAASYEAGVAPGQIVSVFGAGLASGTVTPQAGQAPPGSLGGAQVRVTDSRGAERHAPLFLASLAQLNILIPPDTALGPARLTVLPPVGANAVHPIDIRAVAPGLFSANASGMGVAAAVALHVRANGSRDSGLVFGLDPLQQRLIATPIDLGSEGDQVFLLLFGTGIRGATAAPTVVIGGEIVNVLGAVPQGEFAGLDQVNVGPLPGRLAGRGEVDILMFVDGVRANPVTVRIR
jgi:uncharacterized protein (TIGR03437 family)